MIKSIVTGVDGSETAARAARTAAELASATGARLCVLSAYGKFESETYTSGAERFLFTTEQQAADVADEVVAGLRRDFPAVEIEAIPAEGKPADALVNAAQRKDADLIVVGNKRVQGIARVLGSVARDVMSQAPCDVYVAHTHQRP